MRNTRSSNRIRDWARLAAKFGLLLTEPKVRDAIGDQLKDRMDNVADAVTSKYDNVADTVNSKYEEAVDRLEAAGAALRGKSHWPSRTMGFLLGVGVGAGLGILLAPATGRETRETIRGGAIDMKDKVVETASTAARKVRHSASSMPFTGTEG